MCTESKVLKQLQAKKAKLEEIISSNYPFNIALFPNHRRKVAHAKSFLNELEDVIELVSFDTASITLQLVPKPTFEKLVAKADFATEEFDGIYCKVCNICSCPAAPMLIIYTSSFDVL